MKRQSARQSGYEGDRWRTPSRLDKLGVTGSSPVPPTSESPAQAGFFISADPPGRLSGAAVATEWQRSSPPAPLVCGQCCRADREGDGRGWRADWAGEDDDGLERALREHRSRQATVGLHRVRADALVFTTSRGRPQSRRNALRALHAAGDAAGLNSEGRQPVGLHDCRHSYVAAGLAAGASLADVAALARHANARVTGQLYAGITDHGRETAAAKLVEAGFGR